MPRYPHIYFESKRPGKDAVFSLVHDIGKTGVNTPIEVAKIAVAQLWDYVDGFTKDHSGRTVPFTKRKWAGRYKILLILSKKYGGRRVVKLVEKIRRYVDQGIIPKSAVKRVCREIINNCNTVKCIIKKLKTLLSTKVIEPNVLRLKVKVKKNKKKRKKHKKVTRVKIPSFGDIMASLHKFSVL